MWLWGKGLRSDRLRTIWDDLGCFRPFDVRLLFGLLPPLLEPLTETMRQFQNPDLRSSPYGKPIPNRPFVRVEKQCALIFDGRLEHPPCGLISFEQFLELIYLGAQGERQRFDPHCQAD